MNAASKLNVLWHDHHVTVVLGGLLGKMGHALDCHALAVDCAQVCVLKNLDKVVHVGLLEGEKGHALEARV